jgi:hypothetical protein
MTQNTGHFLKYTVLHTGFTAFLMTKHLQWVSLGRFQYRGMCSAECWDGRWFGKNLEGSEVLSLNLSGGIEEANEKLI